MIFSMRPIAGSLSTISTLGCGFNAPWKLEAGAPLPYRG
jgi:hypothetical protein